VGREIERKFLVVSDAWRDLAEATDMRQGYLAAEPERSVRVRLAAGEATLTIKGPSRGAERDEWEYSIPPHEGAELLAICRQPLIEKTRWRLKHGGRVWEVDEFRGANAGLVMAECELPHADAALELPAWVGEEVTADERYYNAYLARHPYGEWRGGEPVSESPSPADLRPRAGAAKGVVSPLPWETPRATPCLTPRW
jgi:adenylate cyclase